ncbi:hypothetical protein BGW39_011672 [Mortierella sp. 14UC]|nr:hypothetical protein BGW39_011672 [Mortierella sp. 14UC]
MFYSKEILSRKDTQLGLIWLAATLGPRSGINKLSKKLVNGVNIAKSCRDISQPVEPFALRFSSNLMVGVVRVYSQQYNFYYSDVNNTWMRLKRDLAAAQSENLDMMIPGAKIDAITFEYDLTIEQDLFRPASFVQNYEIEVARNSRNKEVAVEFGWAPQSSLDTGDNSSDDQSPPLLFLLPATDERRRRITLEERPGMAGKGLGIEQDAINAGVTDDMLIGEDDGLYIDAEGNLRTDMPDQGFAIGDDRSIFSGSPDTPATTGTLGKCTREESILNERIVPENNDLFEDILQEIGEQNMAFGAEIEGATQPKRQRTGPIQRRPVGLREDENTTLSEEELKAFRDKYLRDQAALNRNREAKEQLASAKAHIDSLLGRPLGVAGFGTDLGDFWKTAGAHTLDNDRMSYRGIATALPIGRPRNEQPTSDRGARESSWVDPGEDDQLFMDAASDLEMGRRLTNPPSASTPTGASTGGFGLDSISSSNGRDGGTLPWDQQAFRRSVGGQSERSSDSDHPWQDFDSAFNQGAARGLVPRRRRRTGSVDSSSSAESAVARAKVLGGLEEEEDAPLIRRRRHQSVLGRSRTPSLDSGRRRQLSIFEDVGGEQAGYAGGSGRGEGDGGGGEGSGGIQERLALERATANFLGYARSLLEPLNTNSFSFEEVIASHRRRDVAAAAFYHILALSTMGVMRPRQDVPYQDIQVKLIG